MLGSVLDRWRNPVWTCSGYDPLTGIFCNR